MATVVQDKFILAQSKSASLSTLGQELRIDLNLIPSKNDIRGGKISGKVQDKNGNPVSNAVIKLMTIDYDPVIHAVTDSSGNYSISNLIPGSYNIFAIASKMKLNQGNPFSITQFQNLNINFTLEQDSSMSLAIIAGDIFSTATNKPIGGAVVALYLQDLNNIETLTALTYTNEYGQFVFREIKNGTYVIKISGLGYNPITYKISVDEVEKIIPIKLGLIPNPDTARGTISGIITTNENQPVNRADVILYKVNEDKSLMPIAFTKTNINGVYLFTNVPQGNYKVKSSQMETITINV